MTLPDNRIRLPAGPIDFTADVGETGQDHDSYPFAGAQARYDHMRMYLIGLLANQASYSEPTQHRGGTLWYDLNTLTLKIRQDSGFVPLSDVIQMGDVTLTQWLDTYGDAISALAADVTFAGSITTATVSALAIPTSLQSKVTSKHRCFLYVDGLLIDPRLCTLIGSPPSSISLSSLTLSAGSNYLVLLRYIPDSSYYVPDVAQ